MGSSDQLEPDDVEIVVSLYDDLARFSAVVAPAGDDPTDLVQEAIARVLARRRLATLDDPGRYLRRVIVNLASNRRRSLRRRFGALTRLGSGEPTHDVYPSDVETLLALSPETRAVLWMADVEGFGFEQIAEHLSLTPSAARQRASRGRALLRRKLTEGEFDAPHVPPAERTMP